MESSSISLDELLTLKDAALFLGVHPSTLKYHIYTVGDLIPDVNLGGSLLLFSYENLLDSRDRWNAPGRPAVDPEGKTGV